MSPWELVKLETKTVRSHKGDVKFQATLHVYITFIILYNIYNI